LSLGSSLGSRVTCSCELFATSFSVTAMVHTPR
jgi:hypothetical protein